MSPYHDKNLNSNDLEVLNMVTSDFYNLDIREKNSKTKVPLLLPEK